MYNISKCCYKDRRKCVSAVHILSSVEITSSYHVWEMIELNEYLRKLSKRSLCVIKDKEGVHVKIYSTLAAFHFCYRQRTLNPRAHLQVQFSQCQTVKDRYGEQSVKLITGQNRVTSVCIWSENRANSNNNIIKNHMHAELQTINA